MKIFKKLLALSLGTALTAGLALSVGAGPAEARPSPSGGHAPIACKLGGSPDGDGTGICGKRDPQTGGPLINWDGSLYKYYDDIAPWAPLADPLKFPKSDGGLNCNLENDGTLRCWRWVPSTVTAGRDDCTLSQLRNPSSFACRGSVVEAIFEKDESVTPDRSRVCTPETIYYGKGSNGQPRYYSEAMQCYDSGGLPTVPTVIWYRADGKGRQHAGTVMGTTKGYLTSGSEALAEPAATVTASSSLSPGTVATAGTPVNYTISAKASTAGSALVQLSISSLRGAVEDNVPADWVRLASLNATNVTYLIPHMDAGATASATLRFTVDGYRTPSVSADVNDKTSNAEVNVIPPSPECIAPHSADGHPVAVAGSGATLLDLHCSVAPDSTLDVYVPVGRDIKKLSVSGDTVRFVPSDVDFHGQETIYLMARNPGGIASAPIPITVDVVDEAATVDDEYTSHTETALVVDAAGGLLANDSFPGGSRDGWTAVVVDGEGNENVQVDAQGGFRFEGPRHFTGDVTFLYRLVDPRGHSGAFGTATIHVTE